MDGTRYGSLGSSLTGVGYDNGTTYSAWSQVLSTELGNGTDDATITDQYDPHTQLLTDQAVTRNITTPADVDDTAYTYDLSGNITSETDTRLGATGTAETQCYTYTTQDQLSQARTTATPGSASCATVPTASSHSTVGDPLSALSAYDESWTYNTAGDQASQTQYAAATGTSATTTDTYNGNAATSGDPQPTTLTGTTTTGSTTAGTSYGYNKDGEQTSRTTATGSQTLTWNNQGLLTGVTNATKSTNSSYTYDAAGNLLLEVDGANTTLYLPNEQITVNSAGTVVTSDRYYSLPGGTTAVRTGIGAAYGFEVASDQHGTNTLYLNSTGQTPTWRQYDPYGNPRGTAPNSWVDNRGFLDKVDDSTTALTLIGARWYDSATGSFISLDPQLEANDPTQLGGYNYAGNNPVTGSDPTGERWMPPVGCPDCPPPGTPDPGNGGTTVTTGGGGGGQSGGSGGESAECSNTPEAPGCPGLALTPEGSDPSSMVEQIWNMIPTVESACVIGGPLDFDTRCADPFPGGNPGKGNGLPQHSTCSLSCALVWQSDCWHE